MKVVRSETTGLATANICTLPFVLPKSASGAEFALLRTRIPRMPFRFAREAQATVGQLLWDLYDARSLVHLCELLSGMLDAGTPIMEAYYNGYEFEVCAMGNAVTLDADLAAALGVPTVLAANQCYTSAIDEEEMNESAYYRFTVEGMNVHGHYEDGAYTQIVSEVRQDEAPTDTFTSVDNSRGFSVRVTVVRKDGTVEQLYVDNDERITMWLSIEH